MGWARPNVAGGLAAIAVVVAAGCGSSAARPTGAASTDAPAGSVEHGGVEAHLIGLDLRTGKPEYTTALGFPVVDQIAVSGNRVYLAGLGRPDSTGTDGDVCDRRDPVVRGLDAANGSLLWSVKDTSLVQSDTWDFTPLVDASADEVATQPRPPQEPTIIRGSQPPLVVSMRDGANGAVRAKSSNQQLLAASGGVLLAQHFDVSAPALQPQPASLVAIDAHSGAVRWQVRNVYADGLAVDGDTLVVLGEPAGPARANIAYPTGSPGDTATRQAEAAEQRANFIEAIDTRTGRVLWRQLDGGTKEGTHGAVTISGATVVEMLGGQETRASSTLIAYAAASGRVLWRRTLPSAQWSAPVIDDATVYTNETVGDAIAVDLRTGAQRWATRDWIDAARHLVPSGYAAASMIGASARVVLIATTYSVVAFARCRRQRGVGLAQRLGEKTQGLHRDSCRRRACGWAVGALLLVRRLTRSGCKVPVSAGQLHREVGL